MRKLLSSKQMVLLLAITMLATKSQRFPSILAQTSGRDGWLAIGITMIIEIGMLLLIFWINKLLNGKTLWEGLNMTIGKVGTAIVAVFFALYFITQLMIPYKATHDFFSNILFDALEWKYFSIILLFTVVYFFYKGLNTLGRTSEIVGFFILFGLVGAIVLAVPTARLDRILPIMDNGISVLTKNALYNNIWFADYLIVFMFLGRCETKCFKRCIVITYAIMMVLFMGLYITYYAIYENLAINSKHALSSLSQFALLGFDLGRIDWVLVLFTVPSTAIGAGLFGYIVCDCLEQITTLKRKHTCVFVAVLVFVVDIYVLINVEYFYNYITNYVCYYVLAMETVMVFFLLILFLGARKKLKLTPIKGAPK